MMDDDELAAIGELISALKLIIANSDEENEWDAVDKLAANREFAKAGLRKAGIEDNPHE